LEIKILEDRETDSDTGMMISLRMDEAFQTETN
jgi:hypothetical protein